MSRYHQSSILLVITILAISLNACSNLTRTVSKEERHLPTDAYIYGNFEMRGKKKLAGLDSYQTMGFSIKCDDNKTYQILFSAKDPLQVIKLKPSVCSFDEVIYTDASGAISSRKQVPNKTMQSMPIKGGKAYYFGDFVASASSSPVVRGRTYMTWQVESVKNYFAETSEKLKKNYPNLGAVAVENIMGN